MIDALDPRLLVSTVNSVELMEDERPTLQSLFFGGGPLASYASEPEATESDTFDIVRRTGTNGLAEFSNSRQEANVVGDDLEEVLGTYHFPYISEKTPLEAADLAVLQGNLQRLYRTNPEALSALQDRIVNRYLRNLRRRAENREEWMIFQLLTTGLMTYNGDRVRLKIDLGIDSTYLPVLTSTARWGQSAADVIGNIDAWADSINTATGGTAVDVVMGSRAATLFKKDASVKSALDTNNMPAGRIAVDANNLDLGIFDGLRFRRWAKKYKDAAGAMQPYFPSAGVLMIGSTFQIRRLFGLNEDFTDEGRPADPFFAKTFKEDDPAVKWVNVKSRPFTLPTDEGSWVFAMVE